MGTFLTTFLPVTAGLLVCGIPVFYVAFRRGMKDTIRNFVLLAVGLGVLAGFIEFTSERYVEQCFAAGNPICEDPGGPGLLSLIVVGFLIASISRAVVINRR